MTTRRAVGLGCLIAVLGPVVLLAWGIFSYMNAPQPAWSLAWSPDGKLLAAGYGGYGPGVDNPIPSPPQDYTVRIWEIDRPGRPEQVLTAFTSAVLTIAFSPDGRRLATGDDRSATLLWDLNDLNGQPTTMHNDQYSETGSASLAFSPDGQWLVGGGSYQEVSVWAVTDPVKSLVGLIAPRASIAQAGFMPDSKRVVAVSDEGLLGFWDRTAPKAKPTLLPKGEDAVAGRGAVRAIAITKDGQWVAGAGEEGIVWLWDLQQPQAKPTTLPGKLENPVKSLALSPNGKVLVASTGDEYGNGYTFVWDLTGESGEPRQVNGAAAHTTDLEFSPDGKWLAASDYEGSVRVWAADKLDDKPRILGR